jgi:hypothetical protein
MVDRRNSVRLALATAFAAALLLYLPSLPAQVGQGDTAEFQTVPYILGIAHPTGFPAFTLLGWLFTHIAAFGTVAWRMNLFAAICTALTVSAVVWLALALETGVVAAVATAMAFAAGTTIWNGAPFANAHALSGLCIAMALAGSVAFARDGNRRALYVACASAGLGLATHPVAMWVIPAIVVAVLWQRDAMTPRALLFAGALLLTPLLLYGYLPVRSAVVAAQHLDPAAGAPILGVGSFDWDTNHPRTPDGFLNEVLGRHEGAVGAVRHALDLTAFPRAVALLFVHANAQYSPWLLALAAIGALVLALRDRRALSVLVAGTAGSVMFALAYRYDGVLDRYYLAPLVTIAALAAVATRLPLPRMAPRTIAAIVATALVLIAGATWFGNRGLPAGLRYGGHQSVIDAAQRDIPDGAIIVAPWDDAATLGYGANVEGGLGSRILVSAEPGQFLEQYAGWTRKRRVFILAKWGTLLTTLPAGWLHPVPTSLPFYHLNEFASP